MANKIPTQLKNLAKSHYTRVVAFAVLGVVIGALLVTFVLPQQATAPTPTLEPSAASSVVDKNEIAPVRLRVPSVEIDASFEGALGLNADQTIEVPDSYEELGWYKYAPAPGQLGPAVVLGHVDSYKGPAVLFRLGQTEVGDIIEIDRADGSKVKFEIERLDRRSQSDFPTVEVYGDIDYAGLRIITCSGTYDRDTLRYSHNLIVYAKLVEEIPPPAAATTTETE